MNFPMTWLAMIPLNVKHPSMARERERDSGADNQSAGHWTLTVSTLRALLSVSRYLYSYILVSGISCDDLSAASTFSSAKTKNIQNTNFVSLCTLQLPCQFFFSIHSLCFRFSLPLQATSPRRSTLVYCDTGLTHHRFAAHLCRVCVIYI